MTAIREIASHRRFRSHFPAVPLPESFTRAAEVLGGAGVFDLKPGEPICFHMQRSKKGCVVWLVFGRYNRDRSAFTPGLRLNLGLQGATFAEGRKWAADYAAEHGFNYREARGWPDITEVR